MNSKRLTELENRFNQRRAFIKHMCAVKRPEQEEAIVRPKMDVTSRVGQSILRAIREMRDDPSKPATRNQYMSQA